MNHSINVIVDVFSNEIFYEFKMLKIINLLNNDIVKTKSKIIFSIRLLKKNAS